MPIDFEPIEQAFMQTLRAQPAFAGWKKRRKRCLWRALADGVEQGVELLRYRDSFENRQLVSLGLYVSVPCEREWPVYVPPDVWDKGRLYRRACLAPGQGLVGEATLGSGAVIELCSPDDLARWLAVLPADIERYVGPWFSQYDTLATASYEYEIPRWRLQQAGLLP
ncbi:MULTISPECIES: hypothetical protein [Achromobacter]|jgi:hypothetical protein|uniref:Uncharacterized protein n=1 Tax=Achromobacter insuavis TaxID=1287735 RepID=A0A6J5B8S0_9BURK|nr:MULTISPECIES: hypothetical protein [Achromobacter]CAB3696772.1 hypothetical protein LMG26845_05029 [Achromobacter insuavis]CUI40555.1 Uncharacterised protein [Achromobacter sp. 2789STDY5608628]CUI49111.1 Uncharacterised protein [Achromobacter sp. 2789STDY5608633]CUJ47349.1 Uncharacterised protein [Achromobacter sp. 2789STDY5608621]